MVFKGNGYGHIYGVAWLIIVGSRFRDWNKWTSLLQLQFIITAHTSNSLMAYVLRRIYEESLSVVWISDWSLVVSLSNSESESYVTTDGQSARLSWNKTYLGLTTRFLSLSDSYGFVAVERSLSLTRGRACHLQLPLVLASAVIFRSESHGTRDHILLSQIWDFPFRRLLRLARLRWRYSNPPPHEINLLNSRSLFPL
jgi:hypothetical protein